MRLVHGLWGTKEYEVWKAMAENCRNRRPTRGVARATTEAQRKRMRLYYERNREKVLARMRARYAAAE